MREPVAVPVLRVDAELPLPAYARADDAGLDLHAAQAVTLKPGDRVLVPTGIALAIPPGFAGFVVPRSGLALRHGVTVLNTPGLIDAGYRGEVKVIMLNTDKRKPFVVEAGMRIAQLVLVEAAGVRLVELDELSLSERGAAGLGSSG
jgi:dUTP pyrophosphatase